MTKGTRCTITNWLNSAKVEIRAAATVARAGPCFPSTIPTGRYEAMFSRTSKTPMPKSIVSLPTGRSSMGIAVAVRTIVKIGAVHVIWIGSLSKNLDSVATRRIGVIIYAALSPPACSRRVEQALKNSTAFARPFRNLDAISILQNHHWVAFQLRHSRLSSAPHRASPSGRLVYGQELTLFESQRAVTSWVAS